MDEARAMFERRLPVVQTTKGCPESSTEVKYIEEILGRFDFVPLTNYHISADSTVNKICAALGEEELRDPKKLLDAIYIMTKRAEISEEALRRVVQTNITENLHPDASSPAFTSPRVFHDELATEALFSRVLECINLIVQKMTLSTDYSIVKRRIKSKIQYLKELEKLRRENPRMSRICETRQWKQEAGGYPFTTEEPDNSTPAQKAELARLESELDEKKFKSSYLLPDYCLMHSEGVDPRKGELISCVEVKGPQRNITGRYDEVTRGELGEEEISESDLVTVPPGNVTDDSKDLAERYCDILSVRNVGGSDVVTIGTHASARKAVAQAIAYALETSSGMTYLWNWLDAVVLELTQCRNNKSRGICRVAIVNETMPGHVGHVGSLCHFFFSSILRADSKRVSNGLKNLRKEIAYDIARAAEEDCEYTPRKRSRPGQDRLAGGPGSSGVGSTRSSRSRGNEPFLSEVSNGVLSLHESKVLQATNTPLLSPVTTDDGCRTLDHGEHQLDGVMDSTPAESPDPNDFLTLDFSSDDVKKLLGSISGTCVGSGRSGDVYKGKWKKFEVAVKLWNRKRYSDIISLRDEIAWYRWLARFSPETLGEAVPMPRVCWDITGASADDELIGLATDFVGHSVRYKGDGIFVIEHENKDVELTRLECDAVCLAALKSLRELHDAGILHGDVDLRNLRLEQCHSTDKRGNSLPHAQQWRAWWLDLGEAIAITKNNCFLSNVELRDCRALFGFSGRIDLSD